MKDQKVKPRVVTLNPSDLLMMKDFPLLYARIVGSKNGRWVYCVEKKRHFWLKTAMRYMRVK